MTIINRYTFFAKVRRVYNKEKDGWVVVLENWTSFNCGSEPPDITEGDMVRVSFEKHNNQQVL